MGLHFAAVAPHDRAMRAFIILAFLCVAGSALAQTDDAFQPNTGAIFPAHSARVLTNQCSRFAPDPEGVWTPSAEDIARLEPTLFSLVNDELRREGDQYGPRTAASYYRQYGGLIVGGRRIIYINGVVNLEQRMIAMSEITRNHRSLDWRTQTFLLCDGGTTTFGVEYDVATHSFQNFQFNGYA
jgi:hypothetical protein